MTIATTIAHTTWRTTRIPLALLAAFGLAIALIIATLIIYPGGARIQTEYRLLGGVAIVVLALVAGALALWSARIRSPEGSRLLRAGVLLGVLMGLLWVVEITYNNWLTPPVTVRDPVDDVFWASIAIAIFLQSLVVAMRSGRFSRGVFVGFWSGSVSGLLACLMGLILIVFLIVLVTHDPLSIQEWNTVKASDGAPDIATYFAYQTLAGALLHLFVLGILMGVLLGALGGAIGAGVARIARLRAHRTV
ncbi:MAG: hypothetical protein ABI068_06445 [Ktedonobacterales bacterium]